MFTTVELPLWLLILIVLFAAVTFATHFLNPTVRWFFRNRAERVVARLNARLDVPIQPFKLARRHDTILRLLYDPAVLEAVTAHAKDTGVREDVAFSNAERYAREIVPAFSATAYFGFAIRAARWLSTALFRVRVQDGNTDLLRRIDPEATIVFVMNHRSNMDYVLVTWLVGERSALSYAVGEWARVWPLSSLIRAMGAYFIRRRSRNALYRRVLARYVQMATEAGVTQAMFPEGGLSLSGAVGPAKLGLLSYIVDGRGESDVVFVPVALNYDRVIEDRILTETASRGERKFRGTFLSGCGFALRWGFRRITGQVRRFGYAAVAFGRPLALSGFPGEGTARVEDLSRALMAELRGAVPVLPIPLACLALQRAGGPLSEEELTAHMAELAHQMQARDAPMCVQSHPDDMDPFAMLRLRKMVVDTAAGVAIAPEKEALVRFYAASVAHHLDDAALQRNAKDPTVIET
jgi:glycerol-3-phosphate O-acyltransferase